MEYLLKNNLKVNFVVDDVTNQDTDAVVNAANGGLWHGSGVCDAIFTKAGVRELTKECEEIIERVGKVKTGEAVLTKGYNLKAKYIIHAVGPRYRDDTSRPFLENTYLNSLKVAEENHLTSISIPPISTGVFMYPKEKAAKVVSDVLVNYKPTTLKEVRLCFIDSKSLEIYENALKEVL